MYEGNALLIMLNEHNNMWDVFSFWADVDHAKNCLGITKGTYNMYDTEYNNLNDWVFYSNKGHNRKKIIQLIGQAFNDFHVTIKEV